MVKLESFLGGDGASDMTHQYNAAASILKDTTPEVGVGRSWQIGRVR